MAKKLGAKDMASLVQAGAAAATPVHDKFDRAERVVAVRPTGYHETPGAGAPEPEAEANGRKVYFAKIPVEQVDPNPFNARQIYVPQKVSEIAASMVANGQMVPCIGTMRGDRCVLVAGHYRHKGAKKGGLGTLDFMIHEGLTDKELYEMSFRENEERSSQSPLDNALVWDGLIKRGLYTDVASIADAIGQSIPNVHKTMAILKLSEPILDLVKERPDAFALSALYELHLLEKVGGQAVALGMAQKVGEGEAGRKEVSDLRVRLESPAGRQTRESSRQYKIQRDGQNIGFLKDWDSGKVAFEIKMSDPKARADLVEEFKKRFDLTD